MLNKKRVSVVFLIISFIFSAKSMDSGSLEQDHIMQLPIEIAERIAQLLVLTSDVGQVFKNSIPLAQTNRLFATIINQERFKQFVIETIIERYHFASNRELYAKAVHMRIADKPFFIQWLTKQQFVKFFRASTTFHLLHTEKSAKEYDDEILFFIKAGVDVNAADHTKTTALMVAAQCNRIDLTDKLLAIAGIDINLKDINGQTALMHAAILGYSHAFVLLLQAGADTLLCDNDGLTALDLAKNHGHLEIVIRTHFLTYG